MSTRRLPLNDDQSRPYALRLSRDDRALENSGAMFNNVAYFNNNLQPQRRLFQWLTNLFSTKNDTKTTTEKPTTINSIYVIPLSRLKFSKNGAVNIKPVDSYELDSVEVIKKYEDSKRKAHKHNNIKFRSDDTEQKHRLQAYLKDSKDFLESQKPLTDWLKENLGKDEEFNIGMAVAGTTMAKDYLDHLKDDLDRNELEREDATPNLLKKLRALQVQSESLVDIMKRYVRRRRKD